MVSGDRKQGFFPCVPRLPPSDRFLQYTHQRELETVSVNVHLFLFLFFLCSMILIYWVTEHKHSGSCTFIDTDRLTKRHKPNAIWIRWASWRVHCYMPNKCTDTVIVYLPDWGQSRFPLPPTFTRIPANNTIVNYLFSPSFLPSFFFANTTYRN